MDFQQGPGRSQVSGETLEMWKSRESSGGGARLKMRRWQESEPESVGMGIAPVDHAAGDRRLSSTLINGM